MERIYIYNQSVKTTGKIRVRFRFRDGRSVQLFHKSDILADAEDLSKFDVYGHKQGRSLLRRPQLAKEISREMSIMSEAYGSLKDAGAAIDSKSFEAAIDRIKHPDRNMRAKSMLRRFSDYIENGHSDGLFGVKRYRSYMSTYRKLDRFLTITGRTDIAAVDFDTSCLMGFRQFVLDEYKYVPNWRGLYTRVRERDIPSARRSMNTTSQVMKELQSFFTELEDMGEIHKSPFRLLGKERKRVLVKSKYDAPIFLNRDEFEKIMKADIPSVLEETRAAFLLQSSLGCRISDFVSMSMANVSVSKDGIPYVHYLPVKTKDEQSDNTEVETPILRFALDLIKRYKFRFPVVRYASGQSGYNAKIKRLLKACGIDRQVAVYDADSGSNKYVPLYTRGSSHLARKTYENMMKSAQVDLYLDGLHRRGSRSIDHYVRIDLKDRFILASAAFGQPVYHTDSDLNIIGE